MKASGLSLWPRSRNCSVRAIEVALPKAEMEIVALAILRFELETLIVGESKILTRTRAEYEPIDTTRAASSENGRAIRNSAAGKNKPAT